MSKSERTRVLIGGALTTALLAVALYLALLWAPTEAEMGAVQRIFYFHMPTAIAAFVLFFIVFVAAIAWLTRRSESADALAVSAAELGLLATTLVLITGMIFARPMWGVWWTWDPRLTASLVLWFIYVGYFMLRAAIADRDRRATLSAVVGIIGFVDVPIVFMSIRWWRTIHPNVITDQGLNMEPSMALTLIVSSIAVLFLFGWLLMLRYGLERARQREDQRLALEDE